MKGHRLLCPQLGGGRQYIARPLLQRVLHYVHSSVSTSTAERGSAHWAQLSKIGRL